MQEIVYFNGELVPAAEARVSISDHGFLYGYGLFETMRAYKGKIFRLERHLQRLFGSAEAVGLGARLAGIDLGKACCDVLAANNLEDARLRLTVTGGEADAFPWAGADSQPNVVITARSYSSLPPEKYERGFTALLVSLRRSPQSPLSGVKSTSYLVSVLAKREAAAAGADEALLCNDDGYLAEGGSSNVFFVKGSRLVTPSLKSGILPGVTREVVIELADELEIVVTEGTAGISTIKQCDEAFLTASTMEIMPLTEVKDMNGNAVTIGTGKPGEITGRLMAAYKERVAEELGL